MSERPDIARLAALVGDPGRANMLLALLAIPSLTAGELAREAGVTAQTASGHLGALEAEGLLAVVTVGRHRYYRLADDAVAAMLEQLLGTAAALGFSRSRPGPKGAEMRRARTCYDHMAGGIAVELFDRMLSNGLLRWADGTLHLSADGESVLRDFGLPDTALSGRGRPICRSCLDWSERRPHLAGRVGAALLDRFLALGWVTRTGRVLRITRAGDLGFAALFLPTTNGVGQAHAEGPPVRLRSKDRAAARGANQ